MCHRNPSFYGISVKCLNHLLIFQQIPFAIARLSLYGNVLLKCKALINNYIYIKWLTKQAMMWYQFTYLLTD